MSDDSMTLLKEMWKDVTEWSSEHRYALLLRKMGFINAFPAWQLEVPICKLCNESISSELVRGINQHFKDEHPEVFTMVVLAAEGT